MSVVEEPAHLGLVLEELARADARLVELALEELLARGGGSCRAARAQEVADLGARARRPDEIEPVLAGLLVGARQDLDHVAVPELVAERLDLAVDARAGDVLAELGVDREREVDRRRAAREDAHVALGREDVDLVLEEVDLHPLEELGRVLQLLLPLDELAQPAEALRVLSRRSRRPRSLYFQCAAMPRSATRCISWCGSGSRCARAPGR